ncbi:MAG: phosphate regulon transcriptional regulator PhoB [Pseudomonadales bacterium]
MTQILVVDDDAAICEMMKLGLEQADYAVQLAGSALEARQSISSQRPDLILLDWMMPGQSGFDFARSLRKNSSTRDIPIIMLTARAEETDKVAALQAAADDYVSKPFSFAELLARMAAVLRRTTEPGSGEIVEVDSLSLNPETHRVSVNGEQLELAPMEFQLLLFFMTHQERVYSRQQLLDLVWGTDSYVEERTVDVQIRRLRIMLEASGHDRFIQTVRGTGYRFSSRD